MKCKRCGRILKSKESIELGYGPTCYKKIQVKNQKSIFEYLKINMKEE